MKYFYLLFYLFIIQTSGNASCIKTLRNYLYNELNVPNGIDGISEDISISNIWKPDKFLSRSKDLKNEGRKIKIYIGDINQARSFIYNFPIIKSMNFGNINELNNWSRYHSKLDKSMFHGFQTGWEKSLPSGEHMRIRIDWDEKLGGHFDFELKYHDKQGRKNLANMSVAFDCNKTKCSEEDIYNYLKRFFKEAKD